MSDARNEDWLRTLAWDLPTDIVQLERLWDLEHLIEMDCWEAAPEAVRVAVYGELERRQSSWWDVHANKAGRAVEGTFAEDRNDKPS